MPGYEDRSAEYSQCDDLIDNVAERQQAEVYEVPGACDEPYADDYDVEQIGPDMRFLYPLYHVLVAFLNLVENKI